MASLPPHDSQTRIATSPLVEVGPFLASVGCLDCGVLHNIEAVKKSAFLLTIAWPKGVSES